MPNSRAIGLPKSSNPKPSDFIRPPDPRGFRPPTDGDLASEFYRRLVDWINEFDSSLDQGYDVGVRLINFGQAIVFHLDDISYWNPSLILFHGATDKGEPVELIQHVSQISILLMKLKRLNPDEPKRKIGFRIERAQSEEESSRD